jgi:hypothetical protein
MMHDDDEFADIGTIQGTIKVEGGKQIDVRSNGWMGPKGLADRTSKYPPNLFSRASQSPGSPDYPAI